MNLDSILPKCVAIVQKSGEIMRDNWQKPHDVRFKGAIDLVTETDLAIQAFLAEQLGPVLPEAQFIGEEGSSAHSAGKALSWVVDPVDGTTNFVHRVPFTGISVALCENGQPLLGIVNAPLLGECFYAVKGGGAFVNGQPIKVSKVATLSGALVCTGFPYDARPALKGILGRLERILPISQGLRRLGAASLDLAYVACGRLDCFYEEDLKPWDFAAGWLLVEEAGGKMSDFQGGAPAFGKPVLASNGLLHDYFVALL